MAEISSQTSAQPIRLNFSDRTPVVVTPADEDRFMTTSAEAAYACRQAQDMLRWKHEFDRLLTHLHEWCRENKQQVSRTYMAASEDGLKVFILTKGPDYRFDFDDAISGLDVEVAKKFERCPTDVIQIPETPVGSLTSFFDSAKAWQIYGD